MKLKTGKKYKRRDGAIVEVTRDIGFGTFRFVGKTDKCKHHYAENGRFFSVSGFEHKFDLVGAVE